MNTFNCGALALFAAFSVSAATVTLTPSADTTLHSAFPDNNLGLTDSIVGGATGQGIARGLIKFNFSTIPAGATITEVKLIVNVERVPGGGSGPSSTFEMHRMLVPWIEGTKSGSKRLIGEAASAGEPTWSSRAFSQAAWGAVGAGGAADASTTISSSVGLGDVGAYTFPSTPTLIADVQGWLANANANNGWLIKSASEATALTARTMASKDTPNPPRLEVTYNVPVTELRIQTISISNGNANLTWTGGAPPYRIERAANVLGPWTTFPTTPDLLGSAPLDGALNFFRVAGQVPQ